MEDACYSREGSAFALGATAIGVLLSTVWSGYIFQSSPVFELGQRPLGTGLLSYLFSYYKNGVGVWGYDPVQGAFAPPLRFRFHLVGIMSLWSVLLFYWPVEVLPDQCLSSTGISLSLVQSGVVTVTAYALLQYIIHFLLPGVSHPGGPRDHKIQRIPEWSDTTTSLPSCAKSWRCTVAEDSHEVSQAKFKGTSAEITGEASGRQMWTNQKKTKDSKKKAKIDEKLVLKMASGGRKNPGFNPSSNPNSCDQLFRGQQIREYLARGNKAPDQTKPKTVKDALYKAAHFYSMLQTDDGHWAGDYGGPRKFDHVCMLAGWLAGWLDTHSNSHTPLPTLTIRLPHAWFGSCLVYHGSTLFNAGPGSHRVVETLHFGAPTSRRRMGHAH